VDDSVVVIHTDKVEWWLLRLLMVLGFKLRALLLLGTLPCKLHLQPFCPGYFEDSVTFCPGWPGLQSSYFMLCSWGDSHTPLRPTSVC
jgi:hypothetical protein